MGGEVTLAPDLLGGGDRLRAALGSRRALHSNRAAAAPAEADALVGESAERRAGSDGQAPARVRTGDRVRDDPAPSGDRAALRHRRAAGDAFTFESFGRGTDADAVHASRAGIPTGLISVPLRCMHSSVELAATSDIEAARLIAAVARELTAELSLQRRGRTADPARRRGLRRADRRRRRRRPSSGLRTHYASLCPANRSDNCRHSCPAGARPPQRRAAVAGHRQLRAAGTAQAQLGRHRPSLPAGEVFGSDAEDRATVSAAWPSRRARTPSGTSAARTTASAACY